MISDLTIASQVNTLQEYYDRVYDLQATAHTLEYMLVHDEIKKRIEGCDSYTELGVNQGATLAIAVLQNLPVVRAYDIALGPYTNAKSLFDAHARENNTECAVYEADTLAITLEAVDVLYIDTRHVYNHLTKELKLHGHKAKKYIIFHDTFAQPGLKKAVQEYVTQHPEWSIITDCQQHVGFMTIKRKEDHIK